MSDRNKRQHDDVVAVGQVDDYHVQIIRGMTKHGADYVFRVIKDDKVVHLSDEVYDTVETAYEAAVAWCVPGAQVAQVTEPRPQDFEALNALLYCGGLREPLTQLFEVIELHNIFTLTLENIPAIREKSDKDFKRAVEIITSTHGPFHEATLNLKKLHELFDNQLVVLTSITEANVETLAGFLNEFLK